jgi:cellulose synthase/poly-beta-1,6-N-acetylglucosamine synthase-like glycosyltransferase
LIAGVAEALLGLLAFPVALASGYLLVLTLLSGRRRAPPAVPPRLRFDVVVPAHDEEAGIAATVASLLALDYPEALRRVVVVADNCTDATAERARSAGATVLVRTNAELRGKGYALEHAFAWSLDGGFADAVVVVDADTEVSPNLLRAFAARLEAGAPAIQAFYGVRNPFDSWRTRLMAVALGIFHMLRSLGRERLGCSAGLRGNGMCFSAAVLKEVPHEAFSIVEDLEYGIRLGMAGHRVQFAAEASVLGDMPVGGAAADVQRRRWEGGRWQMARQLGLPILRRGIRSGDRVLVDLGLDLLVPPLAYLAAAAAVGTAVALAGSWLAGRLLWPVWPWGGSLAALLVYVARGWWLSGTGWRGLLGLLGAPFYLVWKIGLLARRRPRSRQEWVRTPRERGSE